MHAAWPTDALDTRWERVCGEWDVVEGFTCVRASTRLAFCFAEQPARSLRVTLQGVQGDSMLCVESDEVLFDIGGVRTPASRIASVMGTHVLAATGRCPRSANGRHEITCIREKGRFTILIDAFHLLSVEDPAPTMRSTSLAVHLFPGTSIASITVEATPEPTRRPIVPALRKPFDLDVCIDIQDDLAQAPWNARSFDSMMELYRRNGVKRIHYVYGFGFRHGFYPCAVHDNVVRTFQAVGEFLPATVRAAHAHGMQVIAVFKPFETALPWTVPYGSDAARDLGRIPALGGMLWKAVDFTERHPHLRMERSMGMCPLTSTNARSTALPLRRKPG